MKRISIPSRLWYENREWDLTFPDRWQMDHLNPPGFDRPALTPGQIQEKVEHPISGPPLKELAQGRKQAVIVFDDMTRPTPVKDVPRPRLRAGRGTPAGFPILPVIKVASNSRIFQAMREDMDVNAGVLVEGRHLEELRNEMVARMIGVVNGERTKAEENEMDVFTFMTVTPPF